MDELTKYLKTNRGYTELNLKQILDKKIMITKNHIENINPNNYYDSYCRFNIITLFEKYGYIFTDDIYMLLVNKDGRILRYIPKNKRTHEICETAVKQNG